MYGDGLDQVVPATTTKLSRMLEDDDSELPAGLTAELGEPTASGVRARNVWRHEAVASSLIAGKRNPYFVESVNDSAQRFRSNVYTLQPKPAIGQRVRVLLTSDQQNRAVSGANYEKVEEVSGLLDAVFFAGDFVDHPNRASQWFDRANEGGRGGVKAG